mmetsp:Transcript_56580/g.183968  ORF Transcript_56580/g.183968 Transcript_56580/m.183968 type:complete len:265 (-) Transcript_56580:191-985(-)
MFACCCTEEGDTYAEIIKKENVWSAATAEDSPSAYIVEAVPIKKEVPPPAAPTTAKPPETVPELPQDEDGGIFTAVLERTAGTEPLGLYLDLSDSLTLYICRVNPGTTLPAHLYNIMAPDARRLRDGDYILEVNGVAGKAKDLAEAIKSGGRRLELKVRRPTLTNHTVTKGGQSLGLDLQFAKQGWVLSICKVLDGAVKSSGADIRAGDRIIRVNGREGKSDELLSMMTGSGSPEIMLSRCPEVVAAYARGFVPDGTPTDATNG